jgi:hypothetical protein
MPSEQRSWRGWYCLQAQTSVRRFYFYREVLKGLSDFAEMATMIHILPGQINHGNRVYDAVKDYTNTRPSYLLEEAQHLCLRLRC